MNSARFKKIILMLVVSLLSCTGMLHAQQLAFPTAEGYGKYSVGGRGGAVYEVTNLNSSGQGSLGAAIGASGQRTVVFRVAGTIEGSFNIRNGNITIAGQTAPGDGICIKGDLGVSADHVIIRYIRVRQNTAVNSESDAIGGRGHHDIILDHVSASWSGDEVMSLYQNSNVTIQWCLISEACAKFVNGENTGHRFGGIWGNVYGTYHHNCFAHNDNRTPRWAGKQNEFNDFRNNVLYNTGYGGCYGGLGDDKINMMANYYKPGPATSNRSRIAAPNGGYWHVSENVVVGSDNVTKDNWLGMIGNSYTRMDEPWPAMPINQQTAEEAYQTVLDHVGCSLPNRDAVDERIIEEVRTGTTTYGNNGIITKPSDVGGWPTLRSEPAPADSDHDGMPDEWEIAEGLNPNNAADRNNVGADGYTMLEKYLNSLSPSGNVVIHVDDDASNDPGPYNLEISDPSEDGTQEHPFDSIQEAIEAVDENGTVRVHQGTYWETIDFLGRNIKVSGFNPYFSTVQAFPVIDANYIGTVVTFDQREDSHCELSGFVLTRGSGIKAGAIICDEADPQISHCVIVGNRCDDPNGGVLYCRNSDSIFDHCTISGNYGGAAGAAFRFADSNAIISNSIVTSNLPEQIIVENGNEPQIRYSDIEGLLPGGIGNIDEDPKFVIEGQWIDVTEPHGIWIEGDYHLQSTAGHWDPILATWVLDPFTSPCIDAGDPDAPFVEPEPNGERVNMGAYGGTNQASRTKITNSRPRPRPS